MKHETGVKLAYEKSEPATHEDFVNRRLIRPSLNTSTLYIESVPKHRERLEFTDQLSSNRAFSSNSPLRSHAETYYYQKQIQANMLLVIVLKNGDELQGTIEWYDHNCLKLKCSDGSGVLLYKIAIRYLYKANELKQPL